MGVRAMAEVGMKFCMKCNIRKGILAGINVNPHVKNFISSTFSFIVVRLQVNEVQNGCKFLSHPFR
jgi:hypothetical protein